MTTQPKNTTQPHDTTCPCGRLAHGIGVGNPNNPVWLCKECAVTIDDLTAIKRPSPYELKAREGGMEAAAAIIEAYGTDLGEYTEEQALELVGACWRGTAARIRELVKSNEAPF